MRMQIESIASSTADAHLMVPLAFLEELSATESRSDVLSVYAKWAGEVVPADRSTIALSEDGEVLRILAIEGTSAHDIGTTLPIATTHIGKVVTTNVAAMFDDISALDDAAETSALLDAGLSSGMIAPIASGGRVFGALAATFKERAAATHEDFLILQIFAKCIGSYLHLHERLESLSKMVLMDPLTGAYNRRYFNQIIARRWEMWLSRDCVFAVVQFDLDFFKRVNDTHGHYVGDTVLKGIVRVANRTIRPEDVLCRMGGEEFALILSVNSIEEAMQVAERLRENVEKAQFRTAEGPVAVTVSMGVAVCRNEHATPKAVSIAADEALYCAKAAGRNRVMKAN